MNLQQLRFLPFIFTLVIAVTVSFMQSVEQAARRAAIYLKSFGILSPKQLLLLILLLIIIVPGTSHATTLKEASVKAAEYFTKSVVKFQSNRNLVITVVNYFSKQNDQTAKIIETELYFALERKFPNFNLVLLEESITGLSLKNTIYIKGTYEQKGTSIILRLQGVTGLKGIILAQTEVEYDIQVRRNTLVAVLDLEAKTMTITQRKAYSDVFRSLLKDIGNFEMASSADIDKMNPDEIQTATGCTRDSCATIIGEQLGVDRAISSSLFKISEDIYILSAKIIDIKDGSILISKTVEHSGSLRDFKIALKDMAYQLTGQSLQSYSTNFPLPIDPQPGNQLKKDSGWPWWYWAIGAAILGGVAASGSGDDSGSSGSSDSGNSECPSGDCGSTTFTW